MSRSSKQKRKSKMSVSRSKRQYPTVRRAMVSLEMAGYPVHRLGTKKHTGNYWVWVLRD